MTSFSVGLDPNPWFARLPCRFRERPQIDPAEVDLRALGLDEDLPFGEARRMALVDHGSVDDVRDPVAVRDHLEASPFPVPALDVLPSTEAEPVFPVHIPTVPVDAGSLPLPAIAPRVVDRPPRPPPPGGGGGGGGRARGGGGGG